ncbi:hypothetical protein [Vampirovibrio chlorellavorus]|uniref:hypothetical protein n=1 Tax=Vampirovibrio chlorellavorus TaxID=758823 RepID=UPI0026EE831B|nr:hypothetical protein [Vampirovibrio chlorellavorus]
MRSSHVESVDFSRSFCTWLLQEQTGYGRFSIEAVLRIRNHQVSQSAIQEEYVLLSQVVAGNVYGQQQLVIEPVYQFAALFGSTHYRVFRTHYPFQPHQDSVSPIPDRFRAIETVIHPAPAIAHQNAQGVIVATQANRPLVTHMTYHGPDGLRAELIFPVKHINVQPVTGQFQVETGPILWPTPPATNSATGQWELENLTRAYTIFNRFDRAEIAESTALEDSSAHSSKDNEHTLENNPWPQARHFRFAGRWPVEIQIAALL